MSSEERAKNAPQSNPSKGKLSRFQKNIRFSLLLRDAEDIDREVRTMEELKKHFVIGLSDVIEHFIGYDVDIDEKTKSNHFIEWLKDRYNGEDKANVIKDIVKLKNDYDKCYAEGAQMEENRDNLQVVAEKLCHVLHFDITDKIRENIETLDTKKLNCLREKGNELKNKLRDITQLGNLRRIARSQDELEHIRQELSDSKLKNNPESRERQEIYLLPLPYDERNVYKNFYYIRVADIKNDEGFRYVGLDVKDTDENENKFVQVRFFDDSKTMAQKMRKGTDDAIRYYAQLAEYSTVDYITKLLKKHGGALANVDAQAKYPEKGIDSIPLDELAVYNISERQTLTSFEAVKTDMMHYIDAGFPLIFVETFEEEKADELITAVATGRNIFEWSAQGFYQKQKIDGGNSSIQQPEWQLEYVLRELIDDYRMHEHLAEYYRRTSRYDLQQSLLVLKDVHNLLKDDKIVADLKYLSQLIYNGKIEDCNIIIVSTVLVVPPELENYLTIVKMGHLTEEEIGEVLDTFCREQDVNRQQGEDWDRLRKKLINALRGLSEFDILNILALAILDERKLRETDIALILKQKRQMIEKAALLEMVNVKEKESDIGGLENLKKWLFGKRKTFADLQKAWEHGVDMPKGVLIAGMPGCGKSLTAKVTSIIFGMPLLKLDMGRVMGKYVGESEKNMRRAIALSEAVAPCVLWLDELEKAFAGTSGEGDSEVTARLLGTFLTWLQEKKTAVFVVATANDALRLPPELLRKGRFDDIFYVGLPNAKERKDIFKIHIKRRSRKNPRLWDKIKKHPAFTDFIIDTYGYSGSDIEAVVREAFEYAYNDDRELTFEHLDKARKAIRSTASVGDKAMTLLQKYRQGSFRAASAETIDDADAPRQVMRRKYRRIKEKLADFWKTRFGKKALKIIPHKDVPSDVNHIESNR